ANLGSDLAANQQIGATLVPEAQLALEPTAQPIAGQAGNELHQGGDIVRQLDLELAIAVVESDRARRLARVYRLARSAHAVVRAGAHAKRIDGPAKTIEEAPLRNPVAVGAQQPVEVDVLVGQTNFGAVVLGDARDRIRVQGGDAAGMLRARVKRDDRSIRCGGFGEILPLAA